jgi:hypothetical protein
VIQAGCRHERHRSPGGDRELRDAKCGDVHDNNLQRVDGGLSAKAVERVLGPLAAIADNHHDS